MMYFNHTERMFIVQDYKHFSNMYIENLFEHILFDNLCYFDHLNDYFTLFRIEDLFIQL